MIYEYLSSIGADISSYEGTTIEKRELGGLLNQEEFRENFGENFQYFLKLLLVSSDSYNFRNRLSHGFADQKEFNRVMSSNIIFIILKICSKRFKI